MEDTNISLAENSDDTAETTRAVEWDKEDQAALIEALLFASGDPLSLTRIAEISGLGLERVALIVSELQAREGGSFEIVEVNNAYQLRTRYVFGSFIRKLRAEKPRRLSAPALETLAIIAYRQPIVKSDIEKIRGVDCTPTIKTLLERELVRIVGQQPTVGQPALYGTTEDFLTIFGLKSLSDLPTLRDLAMFERDPGEIESKEGESNDISSTTEVSV
jgi:segregation and condensation protein B